MRVSINYTLAVLDILKRYSSQESSLNNKTQPLAVTEIYKHLCKDYENEVTAFCISEKMVRTCLKNIMNFEVYKNNQDKNVCCSGSEIDRDGKSTYMTNFYTPKQISDYELKFLIDSIMYSKIFNSQTAQNFARRVQKLSGKNLEEITKYLEENTFGKQRLVSEIDVLENIKLIVNAIEKNCYIKLDFNNYDVNNNEIKLRMEQKDSVIYPLQLILNDGRYALLAHYRNKEKVYTFNVDLISNVRIIDRNTNKNTSDNIRANFERAKYILQHPYLMGGEPTKFKLRVKRKSFTRVVDTFSYTIKIIPNTTNDETVDIFVESSVQGMKKWLLLNYDIVEVLEDCEILNEEIEIALEELTKNFKKNKKVQKIYR